MRVEKNNFIPRYFTMEFGNKLSFFIYGGEFEYIRKLMLICLEVHPKKVLVKNPYTQSCKVRIKERPNKQGRKYAEKIVRHLTPEETHKYLFKKFKGSDLKITKERQLPNYIIVSFYHGGSFRVYEKSISKVRSFVKTIFEMHPKQVFQRKLRIYTKVEIKKNGRKKGVPFEVIRKNLYGITPQEASNFFYENSKKMTPEMYLNNEWFHIKGIVKKGTRISFGKNFSKTFPLLTGEQGYRLLIKVFANYKECVFEVGEGLMKTRTMIYEADENFPDVYKYTKQKQLANITPEEAYNYFLENYEKYL